MNTEYEIYPSVHEICAAVITKLDKHNRVAIWAPRRLGKTTAISLLRCNPKLDRSTKLFDDPSPETVIRMLANDNTTTKAVILATPATDALDDICERYGFVQYGFQPTIELVIHVVQ